jgi:hypothetical protein
MQKTGTAQEEKFVEVIKGLTRLTSSQQKFIQDFLSQRAKVTKLAKKQILKKSFGLWADRDDIKNSRDFVNQLRMGWETRPKRVND